MAEFHYVGHELELFAEVRNWKSYWARQLQPFIHGDILEVGAGIGANTPFLDHGVRGRWVCLEPDPKLAARLSGDSSKTTGNPSYEAVIGTIEDLDERKKFDTIIYIDVLEHIENDRKELEDATALLRADGRIIVLSPAHQWLFSPFDAAIGHFRRYNRAMLRNITPSGLHLERLFYLDSAGMFLPLANLLLLRQSMPTRGQLQFWDRCVIPVSRVLDACTSNRVGKSIVGVWRLGPEVAR
jgi:SAM-dependent methyltransferase